MAGAIQDWPNRLLGACFVAVGGGVATLVHSVGGIASVSRSSAGVYVVTLKQPGVAFAGNLHGPIILCNPINNTAIIIAALLASATTVGVLTFDAAGAAADSSFSLALLSSERNGGA